MLEFENYPFYLLLVYFLKSLASLFSFHFFGLFFSFNFFNMRGIIVFSYCFFYLFDEKY